MKRRTKVALGIGGAGVLVVAGIVAYRKLRKPKPLTLTLTLDPGVTMGPEVESVRCRKANLWTAQEREDVLELLEYYASLGPQPTTTDEIRERSFEITKAVIAQLCPDVPVPEERYQLQNYIDTQPPWWATLWDYVGSWAWNHFIPAET